MKYIVYGCDGHGMDTAGKRTPLFLDGTFMRENEFNRVVLRGLEDRFGLIKDVEFVEVAEGDSDVPLKTRTDRANFHYSKAIEKYGRENVKAIYISVHANAYKAEWGKWGGIDTFFYRRSKKSKGSIEGKKLAEAIQSSLLNGTEMRDRGVKGANFHVLRESMMPGALAECGFMDNPREARLLMSDAYRDECAQEIFEGICQYLGIKPSAPGGLRSIYCLIAVSANRPLLARHMAELTNQRVQTEIKEVDVTFTKGE